MLKDLKDYQKPGLWLAVVDKNHRLKVAGAAKDPQKALDEARKKGFADASLMKSSLRYASFIPTL